MLKPHDAHVVESDPGLPALRVFLDDEAALEIFQEHCAQLQPTAAHCTYLRYKPHTSCLAAYTLHTPDGERLFYAKAYPQGNGDKIKKVIDRHARLATDEPGSFEVRELSAVFTPFPYDEELPALRLLFDRETRKPFLSRLVPEQAALQTARVIPLRYKPERRFVARLELADQPAAVLKIHTPSRYQQARRAMKSLGPVRSFAKAQSLGHSDRYHALLMPWLTGLPLSCAWKSGQADACTFEAVGGVIATVHNLPTRKLPFRSAHDEIGELFQQSNDFSCVLEPLTSRLQHLTRQCAEALPTNDATMVPTHGDFHPGQLLVDGKNVSVIDLDDVAIGNAAYDLGNFLSHLERTSLLGTLDEERKKRFASALLDGYQFEAKACIDHRTIQIYVAAGLIRLIHEPFRHRDSDWHDQQEKILGRAEEILSEVVTTSVTRSSNGKSILKSAKSSHEVEISDPWDARADLRLPFLADALNTALAREAVVDQVQQIYAEASLELRAIRILRYKRGRRCLIAYDFHHRRKREPLTILGKVHAKSRHQQSYRLQQALWNSRFDDQSEDGISVARPIGIVPQWNMWLQECVLGENGWDASLGPRSNSVSTLVAGAADKLHRAEIPTERIHTMDDELRILKQGLLQVTQSMPRLESRINTLLTACRELASSISPSDPTGIHRDFYPDQVLIAGDRIFILDHDLYCLGPPGLDIGNYCAHLREQGIRQRRDAKALATAEQQIKQRFLVLSGDVSSNDLAALTTLSLVRHIYLSTCFADRKFATLSILASCEQLLSQASLGK